MSFTSAFKSITKNIKDLSQLNVRTYTGVISANIDGDDAEAMLNSARQSGNLKLVGVTTMNLDGDVNQFISNDPDIKDNLHTAHFNAVQASQRSRQAVFDMFSVAITRVVGKIDINPED
ncbi:MAG: hypothetical protein RQ899_11305 [Pseudomonadales bacterium]|nr:hypothetical protein [Pseudomonadales bacterium]